MAIIKDADAKRFAIPHEDGEWIECRPLRNGDLIGMNLRDAEEMAFDDVITLFQKLIVRWSYQDDVTPEHVQMLDMETTNWLGAEVLVELLGSKSEKNESTTSS